MVQKSNQKWKEASFTFQMQLSPIKNEHINNYLKLFTQLVVKQLMVFGRTVVAASDLINCTMVNCDKAGPCVTLL